MLDHWKKIICANEECYWLSIDQFGSVISKYLIEPNIDNELLTQFTCPRCGRIETWGVTKKEVMKTLYSKFGYSGRSGLE